MRVAVWEYFCSGAAEIPGELKTIQAEGLMMLRAVVNDLVRSQLADVEVVFDESLMPFPNKSARVTIAEPSSFEELAIEVARRSDCVLVIAPETDAILEQHYDLVSRTNARWCGVNVEAIRLCADKLQTYERLKNAGVPTIATSLFSGQNPGYPFVVKPRFGAGCESTFVYRTEEDSTSVVRSDNLIVQPFVVGQTFSVAAVKTNADWVVLPPVRQHIEGARELQYVGGSLEIPGEQTEAIEAVVLETLQAVEARQGWLGIDFIRDDPGAIRVVDINPRLTTSYAGYRTATQANLAESLIGIETAISWEPGCFEFQKSD